MLCYIENQDRKHIISEKPIFLVISVLNWIIDMMLTSLKQLHNYCFQYFQAGYQITQQFHPLAENGHLTFHVIDQNINIVPYSKTSLIKQIQLEQDSGRTIHDNSSKT